MNIGRLNNRKTLLAAVGVVILGLTTWGIVAFSRSRHYKDFPVEALQGKSPDPAKLAEAMRFPRKRMTRDDLKRSLNDPNLTKEDRRILAQAARLDDEIDEYFAAANESQRQAILDRHIDKMQANMRSPHQGGPPLGRPGTNTRQGRVQPQGPGNSAGGSGANTPNTGPRSRVVAVDFDSLPPQMQKELKKEFSESEDPDRAARRLAYLSALAKRQEQRGMKVRIKGRDF